MLRPIQPILPVEPSRRQVSVMLFLAQQAPIIVRLAPKKDPTGLADVLLGALGLTGVLVIGALLLGAAFAGILFLLRSRKPLDH
jgi:hypothetical protein